PVTLAEAKAHARIDIADDDALITRCIAAAREWVEAETGRALMTQTWRLTLDAWPDGGAVILRRPPVQSVAEIRTFTAGGVAAIWVASNYGLALGREPQALMRVSAAWPVPGRTRAGIEIDITCGYGALPTDVPAVLRQAVLVQTARLYARRGEDEAAAPLDVLAMIAPYRVITL
ncbi:MAG TPA: hypothetical protein DCL54_18220, partial [Alphaproteobacteria bacterium]|nr:hypothetical protein [Alphaproteobacteria bacterium]